MIIILQIRRKFPGTRLHFLVTPAPCHPPTILFFSALDWYRVFLPKYPNCVPEYLNGTRIPEYPNSAPEYLNGTRIPEKCTRISEWYPNTRIVPPDTRMVPEYPKSVPEYLNGTRIPE